MTVSLQRPATDNPSAKFTGNINGSAFEFHFDTNKPTQRYICEILCSGHIYEAESTLAIAKALRPGDTFFDVGANCGWFSAVAIAHGANVVAFEPDTENCTALHKNAPGAIIVRAVVSDRPGWADLFVNLDNDGGHALWPCGSHPHNTETARQGNPTQKAWAVRLDDYEACSPTVIKIDTEGAECNVLLGAERVLSNPNLRLVVCEKHETGLELLGHSPEEVENIMRRHGFKWSELPDGESNTQNWIFYR